MSDLTLYIAAYSSELIVALVLCIVLLVLMHLRLQAQVGRIQSHYQRLARGGSGASLEDVLERHLDRIDETATNVANLDRLCRDIEQTLEHTIQQVGIVRFNPFVDTGGDQSFSIALLDGAGDGLVISSLFGRSETRVFAKPVQKGQSKYTLTGEELEAIQLASGNHPVSIGR